MTTQPWVETTNGRCEVGSERGPHLACHNLNNLRRRMTMKLNYFDLAPAVFGILISLGIASAKWGAAQFTTLKETR